MNRTRRYVWAGIALAPLLVALACTSPTLTLATQEPIEIRIDLHHEVRVHLDREVTEILGAESAREDLSSRSGDPTDDQLVRTAKERGLVGEQADGYLGIRANSASEGERALVARVNASRRAEYKLLAEDYRAPVEEVAKLAGASRIAAAGPGEVVRTPDGAWIDAGEAKVVVVEGGPDA